MRRNVFKNLIKKIAVSVLSLVLCMTGVYTDALTVQAAETGVTVRTGSEFLTALSQNKSPITVNETFSVSNGADESGKMYPVNIPAGTVIRGGAADEYGNGPSIDFWGPIQITGDNVVIENIELQFSSADALDSEPHREIFLAGHSLTLDNVGTYLEGADGSLGGFGGSESELLPTVYAGAFEGTSVGNAAALTIKNANEDSVFQGIYMGHGAGADNKVEYTGQAYLQLGEKVTVRDGIFTDLNEETTIEIIGAGQYASSNNIRDCAFYGNENTSLSVKNMTLARTKIGNVGNLILDEESCFELTEGTFQNITIVNGACLDLNGVRDVIASGDFSGGEYDAENDEDSRGVLLLNKEGSLTIEGSVSGETFLLTENKNFPGAYIEKTYVTSAGCEAGKSGFVLPDEKKSAYELNYENNGWSVAEKVSEIKVTSAEVVSAPSIVDVKTMEGWLVPDETVPYCEIVWKDADGNELTAEEIDEIGLYYYGAVITIKTEYWEKEGFEEETDFGPYIELYPAEVNDGKYYLYTDSVSNVESGEYTVLLCSEIYQGALDNVGDVKNLKEAGYVLAEFEMTFYNSELEEKPEPVRISISANSITVMPIEEQEYTGEALCPSVTIKDGEKVLVQNEDYSLTYMNNTNVGTAKVIIEGMGNYTGTREVSFNIVQKTPAPEPNPGPDPDPEPDPNPDPDPNPEPIPEPKEGLWFEIVEEEPFYYTGREIKPVVKVYEGEKELGKKDYTVSYSNNKKAGTEAEITVIGKGNYKGKDSIYFTIEKKDIGDTDITAPQEVFSVIRSDGTVKNPDVTLKLGKNVLKANTKTATKDYEIIYEKVPVDEEGKAIPGEYMIWITGNGVNFTGSRNIVYRVIENATLQMSKAKISIKKDSPIQTIDYAKPDILPEFSVKIGTTVLTKDVDYEINCPEFTIGKNVITFVPLETSEYSLYGTKDFTVTVTGESIKQKDILVSGIAQEGYEYTGTEIILGEEKEGKPGKQELQIVKVTERDEQGNVLATEPLTENVDYVLSYKNNKKAGTATITIKGINGYAGSRKVNFTIKKIDLQTATPDLLKVSIADSAVYSKNGAKAAVTISYNGVQLVEKQDYTLTYKNYKKVGNQTAKVIVKGKGSFTNEIQKAYSILPSGDVEIIFEAADMVKPKTVAKVKPKLTVKEKVTNKNLVAKIDYSKDAKYYSDEACTQEITQQDLVVGKTLWAKITLKGNYDDGKTSVMKADFRLCNKLASGFKVEKIEPIEYTGKEIRPSLDEKIYITVKENGATKKVYLQENVHYTVEYPNGENIKVGKGKVMVHGIGEYGGSKTISFNITKKSVKFDLKGFLQEWFSV